MCNNPKSPDGENKPSAPSVQPPELKKKLSCIDKWAFAVLVAVIVTALALICMFGYGRYVKEPVRPNVVSIVIQVDTTGVLSPETKIETDKIIATFEAHEHLLKDKYEHILEQKEDIKDYFTWGGMLVTIVLSIFGFFGFRSLQSIDERVVSSVTPKASDKAIQSAEHLISTRLKDYLDNADKHLMDSEKIQEGKISNFENATAQKLEMEMSGKMNKQFAIMRKDITSAAEEATKAEFNRTFSNRISDIEANSQDIQQLQQDYTTLRALCDEYERRMRILELRNGQKTPKKEEPKEEKRPFDYQRRGRNDPDPFNKK